MRSKNKGTKWTPPTIDINLYIVFKLNKYIDRRLFRERGYSPSTSINMRRTRPTRAITDDKGGKSDCGYTVDNDDGPAESVADQLG